MSIDPELLRSGLIYFLVLIASLAIHEWAHAFSADRLGDPTPDSEGRVTLNPLPHLDPIGSFLIPLFNILFLLPATGGSVFLPGWGRPVRINPSYFRHKVRDDLIVTLAGPGSNIALALVTAVLGGLLVRFIPGSEPFAEVVVVVISVNVGLAVFNLMPIPPLDGGRVMRHVVGMSEETFLRWSLYGGLLLLLLINLQPFRILLGTLHASVLTPIFLLFRAIAIG